MLSKGFILAQRYQVIEPIQSDYAGRSSLFLSIDTFTQKRCLIKSIKKYDGSIVRRLVASPDILKRLHHPFLVGIYDVIEVEEFYFIIMEKVDGVNFEERIRMNKITKSLADGIFPLDDVLLWGRELCDALSYLHSFNPPIIVRKLTPSSIILKSDGSIVLQPVYADCGYIISKWELDSDLLSGYNPWMAPELWRDGLIHLSDDGKTVLPVGGFIESISADIFSIGSILYYFYTGAPSKSPPDYQYHSICKAPLYSCFDKKQKRIRGLNKIIYKCLQLNPDDRFRNCFELKQSLEHPDSFVSLLNTLRE